MLTSALVTLLLHLAPALATPVNVTTPTQQPATEASPWQPAVSGRSYAGSSYPYPDHLLTNNVDDQEAASAVGSAQFSPIPFNGDYYRSRFSDQYAARDDDDAQREVATERMAAVATAQDRKDGRARPVSRRRARPPSSRHGHEDYDDYEDRDGEYGYGYGYEADGGYYEHGGSYGSHHLHPHHGYDSHRFRPLYHTHHAAPVYLPQEDHSDKYVKFGLLAALKLLLAKIKAVGVFKVLLLLAIKLPIFLLTLLFKFFLVTKFFKLLTLPLLLLPLLLLVPLLLLPLLPLAPLLLLPLLLPLLLLLPVPVLTPGTGGGTNAGRRRRSADADTAADSVVAGQDLLLLTRQVLEADQCLERIACQLAEKQRSTVYNTFVIWVLEKIHLRVVPEHVRPRLSSYLEAYREGSGAEGQCRSRYACDRAKLGLYKGSLLQQLL